MTSRADDDETTAFVTMYLQGSLSPVRRTLVFQGELVPLDRGKELAVSLVELLSDLSRRGIRLRAEGGQLSIEAPKGALTPDLRGTLEAHKPELLELLQSKSGAPEPAPPREGASRPPTTTGPLEGPPLSADDIYRNARTLAAELRERSPEIEAARRLPADVAGKLREAGLFRLNMPQAWGGPELTSMQQNEVIEEISRGNASAGWCVMIGSDSGIVSAYLDQEVAREMYPRLDMVQAGWYFPAGKAWRVKGGYRVTGKWRFGSGCTHCDWLSAGCVVVADGLSRAGEGGLSEWKILLARPAEFELIDSWRTTGLQGSGSLDYRCENLFVPEEHAFSFFDPPRRPGILYCRPDTYLRKMPGIPLGVAREAIDTVKAMLADRLEFPSRRPYREMPRVQSAIAEAETLYGAARSYLFTSLERQWEKLAAGTELTKEDRAHLWLSRTHVFQSARRVVQLLYDTLGGGAIYSEESPLDRHLRDVITMSQHLVGQTKGWEAVGALLLGAPSATPYPFL